MTPDPDIEGAVEMARHWVRNPERMTDAGFEQVCRELYTVSRALTRLASRLEAAEGEDHGCAKLGVG